MCHGPIHIHDSLLVENRNESLPEKSRVQGTVGDTGSMGILTLRPGSVGHQIQGYVPVS